MAYIVRFGVIFRGVKYAAIAVVSAWVICLHAGAADEEFDYAK
jgi:hypothetical protein